MIRGNGDFFEDVFRAGQNEQLAAFEEISFDERIEIFFDELEDDIVEFENKELAFGEHEIPQNETGFEIEGAKKHRVKPFHPKHRPHFDLGVPEESEGLRRTPLNDVLDRQVDALVGLFFEGVVVEKNLLTNNKVAKHLEGSIGRVDYQKHHHKVGHALDVF